MPCCGAYGGMYCEGCIYYDPAVTGIPFFDDEDEDADED